MDTPTPDRDSTRGIRRLIGASIIGIGGMLLLNQFMMQFAPDTTAERADELRQIEHRAPPSAYRTRIVEA